MSIAPATASSSSSQSSSESWQPSQEANFQTASRGRRGAAISDLPYGHDVGDTVVTHDRAILAHEIRSELAMTAKADGTLHVAFHRQVDVIRRHSRVLQG